MRIALLGIAAALWATTAPAEGVKMSHNGACHSAGMAGFAHTTGVRGFATMADCLGAGGHDPVLVPVVADQMAIVHAQSGRIAELASTWITTTGGCRDAREDLLARAARSRVAWAPDGCTITAGVWTDAMTGEALTDPSQIIITHTIPLDWAEGRGAREWSPAKRAAFFADRDNLVALSPTSWTQFQALAPFQAPWATSAVACARASAFLAIAQRHGLALTPDDLAALRAANEEGCAAPSVGTIRAEHATRNLNILRARAAFDAIHGVTPAMRAANPNPAPSSYPEGYAIPAVPLPLAPGVPGSVAVVPHTAITTTPAAPAAVVVPQTVVVAPRPPVALPGAYQSAPPMRDTAPRNARQDSQQDAATGQATPVQDGTDVLVPPEQMSAEERADFQIEQLEAQGIMPPGYAPGTAPDFDVLLQNQGIDPRTVPGFDGSPALMGMGMSGASVTIGQ